MCKVHNYVDEFGTYIARNSSFIVNYGERWRYGELISTGFIESAVNYVVSKRFCKRQQMQWTKQGAHLLLQTRTKVLNDELRSTFEGWYPKMLTNTPQEERMPNGRLTPPDFYGLVVEGKSPVIICGQQVSGSASIGVTWYPAR